MESDLTYGQCYPSLEQLGPKLHQYSAIVLTVSCYSSISYWPHFRISPHSIIGIGIISVLFSVSHSFTEEGNIQISEGVF